MATAEELRIELEAIMDSLETLGWRESIAGLSLNPPHRDPASDPLARVSALEEIRRRLSDFHKKYFELPMEERHEEQWLIIEYDRLRSSLVFDNPVTLMQDQLGEVQKQADELTQELVEVKKQMLSQRRWAGWGVGLVLLFSVSASDVTTTNVVWPSAVLIGFIVWLLWDLRTWR